MRPHARPLTTPEDILAGIAIRHEAYTRKYTVLSSQAQSLAGRRAHRAQPWALDRGDGVLVATLLCYPLEFALDGKSFAGYGLGSVGTRIADRREGHAAALCRAACEANERAGRGVGLLFSDIAPAYYARLGFRTEPLEEFRCERLLEFAESGDNATLSPIDPRREVDRLAAAYTAFHHGTLHPRRDAARFLESVEDSSNDWFFAIGAPERAYARMSKENDGTFDLVELILDDLSRETAALRAVARLAFDAGAKGLTGWLPTPPEALPFCTPPRPSSHVPMFKGAPPHASSRFWPSDHF